MNEVYHYAFPAIRGVQAGREYFVSMCPLRLVPRLFLFDEGELVPEVRAQRSLNKSRVPALARYLTENPSDYVLSAITASVDADLVFEPLASETNGSLGMLRIPMAARFLINDGQHRRAAIEVALRERPELGDETLSVVFFADLGLKRSQQMFADLNRYAMRPSPSLSVLYDHRDGAAELIRRVVAASPAFKELVETERTALSLRSRRLFTLSALHGATNALLADVELKDLNEGINLATAFWEVVSELLPGWTQVRDRKLAASEVRTDFIYSHGVVLHALGKVGNTLLLDMPSDWMSRLSNLSGLDWSRSNVEWEGRAVIGGRVSKASNQVVLTSNRIKQALELPLTPDEQVIERAFSRRPHESVRPA